MLCVDAGRLVISRTGSLACKCNVLGQVVWPVVLQDR